MKRILYITAFPPNQKTGGQTFSVNAINELSKSYSIDLYYFSYPNHTCEIRREGNITSITKCEIRKFGFLKKIWIHPIFTRRFNNKYLKKIQSLSSNYDILYFDFSQVAIYSLYINHPNKVLRIHDVMYQKFSRKNYFLAKWVIKSEKKILKSFSKVFVPSIKDVDLLKTVYNIKALYTNEYLKSVIFPCYLEQKNTFVFYGYWRRSENTEGLIWFIEEVLPLLNSKLKIIVIGGGMSNIILEKYLVPNGIDYMGFVQNPLNIIMGSSAVLVPLFHGAGIKVKVIDSFTVGTPVIGTELAFEGLPNIEELSYCVNNKTEFAKIVNDFIPLSYEEKINKADTFNSIYNKHHLLEQL
ncbi:MAG: glycosyltransferase [Treponema sp.]|nr:glycosyltransferase [Treponema sp.]MCI7567553.1 glycosyltransferase [Treponema sp.]